MPTIRVPTRNTAQAWRDAARGLVAGGVPPEDVIWQYGECADDLFAEAPTVPPTGDLRVPKSFVELTQNVCWHADPERFARLYALLWRLRDTPGLMSDRGDAGLAKLREMEKSVNRDKHKMKAFLRFREIDALNDTRRRFAAWFEPSHHIVEPLAGFFMRRFGDMDWVIVTPDLTATFTDGDVVFSDGQPKPPLPEDATEELWSTYFRNIFNPARLKIKAMQAEMPKKYWKNMPEAALIPELIASAETRVRQMQASAPTLPPVRAAKITERLMMDQEMPPPATDLEALRRDAGGCTRCPLYSDATQVVMGEGPLDAPLMIVGEQPGDQEDLAGRPFVGPAGQLFDQIAAEVGLPRDRAFVTNAVKHFKFTARGKRRIHQKPDAGEVQACRWWLDAERQLVKPGLILAMGATAAGALTGRAAGIMNRRGTFEETPDGTPVLLTLHPSYLLRVPNAQAKEAATRGFRADLAQAADWLKEHAA
ncbi:Uracil DNA glycosylase superfamily protein [Rhodobacteraceae bacterium THAF1]|uniref:UdgX family uracil-DNA binding protein n=1 Tax=Palleronia sp. THAF1 TaxID=2587842 RepID=UPI000F3E7736|nr:UdgX family uracil-DNA binding protein [Palleronia sp. THAF1]QFU09425.1 Uracil DNA glycosylase superfamily protein [Palleronia sp. THAF1]VDC21935.1 Uracil DNA glycosylase superfamily protein [Rhodobacteraceae bacterium THAF1]